MEQIPKIYIYVFYTGFLGILMLLIVPRRIIHSLAVPSIIYGAILDIAAIIILYLIGAAFYQNYGPFGIGFIPFFPPIAWTAFYILYLYLLPIKKPWNYIFPIIAAGYSTFFANILNNLEVFILTYSNYALPFFLYLSWNILVTWSYLRYFNKLSLYENNKQNKDFKLIRNTNKLK